MYGFFKDFVLKNNLVFYLVAVFGLILVAIGVSETNYEEVPFVSSPSSQVSAEVFTASTGPKVTVATDTNGDRKIYIDIQGAVNIPGVYELQSGQRISDALVLAGELSPKADKKWVSQNINRAVILQDGDKIYIPSLGEATPTPAPPTTSQPTALTNMNLGYLPGSPTASSSSLMPSESHGVGDAKISLNHATSTELDALPGIGTVRAQKIIQGRPYQKTEDLVERKIIYRSLYDQIKNQITP